MQNINFLPKSRWLVTIILLLSLGISHAWGDNVTLTLSDNSTDTWTNQGASGGGTEIAMYDKTVTGITLEGTSGYCNTGSSYTQIYASSTTTIASEVGKITKIVFNGKYKSTSGSFTDENSSSQSFGSSFGNKTFTYASGVSSMGFTASKQIYLKTATVYYAVATTSTTSITGLDYTAGSGPSTAQSFTVSGADLTGNLTVSAPTNFEVCKTSGGTYTSSVTLTPSSGTVSSTTIYVRLASGKSAGTYGGASTYVTVSGGGIVTKNVSVSGTVTAAGSCTATPSIGDASLNGSFSLSSVGVSCASSGAGTSCSITEYGWVWSDGATNTDPEIGGTGVDNTTKTSGAPGGSGGSFTGTLSGTFTLGHTYYYKAYVTNGKPATAYSSVQSFTPRQVTFHKNDGGTPETTSTQIVKGGVATALTTNEWTRSGYTFNGWNTQADGKGTNYTDGGNITASGNVDLYAKWQEKTKYTITLDAGNGTISDGSWTNTSGSVYTRKQSNGDEEITLPTPSCNCAGWVFQGWSTTSKIDAASFTPDKADGASFVPASNVTYYAVYRQSTQTSTTYTKITTEEALTTGDYAIVAYGGSYYYAMGDGISSSHMTESSSFSSGTSWTNSTANYIWTIIKVGDKVAFYNANIGKFLTIVDGAFVLATDGQKFSYSFNSTTKAWTFTSPSGKQIGYDGYYYVQDAQVRDIYLYKRGYTESGNYYTSPSCSSLSVTGASNPAGAATIYLTNTSAREGDKIWATYTMNRGYSFNSWSKSGTGATISSTSADFTQLTVGSTDATITAVCDALTSYTLNYNDGDGSHTMTVYEGEKILDILPEPSESCDGTSTTFVGWSTSAIFVKTDDEPTFVSSSAVINSTTAAETYYAVYALASGSGSGSIELSYASSSLNLTTSYESGSTKTVSDIDFYCHNIMTGVSGSDGYQKIQFKKSSDAGYIYNSEILPGNITSIVFGSTTRDMTVNFGSSSNPDGSTETTTCTSSSLTATPSGSYKYFKIIVVDDYATYTGTITINYSDVSYSKYITTCCDKIVTLSDGSPTNGTVSFSPVGPIETCSNAKNVTMTITPDAGYYLSNYSSSGVSTSNSPSIATTGSASEAAQEITLTFAKNTTAGTYTAGATFSAKPLTGWTWKYKKGGDIEDGAVDPYDIPDVVELYKGERAKFIIAGYTPSDVIAAKQGYVYTSGGVEPAYSTSYLSFVSKDANATYFLMNGKAAVTSTTMVFKAVGDASVTKTITFRVKELPVVHFVDNVHNESFADVVSTVSAVAPIGVVSHSKTAPTHDEMDDPGSGNACERNHLYLIGWIRSDYTKVANYMNGTGSEPTLAEIFSAGTDGESKKYFLLPGETIDTSDYDGKTFYAVWGKKE